MQSRGPCTSPTTHIPSPSVHLRGSHTSPTTHIPAREEDREGEDADDHEGRDEDGHEGQDPAAHSTEYEIIDRRYYIWPSGKS